MENKNKGKNQPIPENAQKVFKGIIFDVYQWKERMYNGSIDTFEKLKRPDTANIIAFTEDGKVIILEQQQPDTGVFFSLPGGRMDKGENAEECAKRELLEETGYACESIKLWNSVEPMSKIDWKVYFFIAKGCRRISEQKLDNGEKIEAHVINFEEFIDIIFSGQIKSPEIIMKLFKDELIPFNKEEAVGKIKNSFLN